MPGRFQPIPPNIDPAQANAIINKNFAELDHQAVTSNFYIARQGFVSVDKPINDDTNGVSFAHELNGKPAFLCYYTDQTQTNYDQMPFSDFTAAGLMSAIFTMAVTDTNVIINCFTPNVAGSLYYPNAGTFYFKYYLLLQQSAG